MELCSSGRQQPWNAERISYLWCIRLKGNGEAEWAFR